jgi:hypothetical protein
MTVTPVRVDSMKVMMGVRVWLKVLELDPMLYVHSPR